jgi:hypothetical protein
MNAAIQENLDAGDDPELWRVALDGLLPELEAQKGIKVEIGRDSSISTEEKLQAQPHPQTIRLRF